MEADHHARYGALGYEIVEALQHGTRTRVFKAIDRESGDPVVIKEASCAFLSPDEVSEFFEEAQRLKSLDDGCFPKVRQVVWGADHAFIVLDFVEGIPLCDWAPPGRPRTLGEIATVIASVAEALAKAHQVRVIHRDVKPANIIVRDDLSIVLIDFGAGLSSREAAELPEQPYLKGTIGYMSPEQAMGNAIGIQGRTDIYSLGLVLYRLLTGLDPFGDRRMTTLIRKADNEERWRKAFQLAPVEEVVQDLPDRLSTICMKCAAFDPEERYHSATRVAVALRKWRKRAPWARKRKARSAASVATKEAGAPQRSRHRFRVAVSVLLGVVATAIVLALLLGTIGRDSSGPGDGTGETTAHQGSVQPPTRAKPTVAKPTVIEQWSVKMILPATKVTRVAWSPNGHYLAYGTMAGRLHVCDPSDFRIVHVLDGHAAAVTGISWSADGELLASCARDATARLWAQDGEEVQTFAHDTDVVSLSWSPDSRELATLDNKGRITLWKRSGGLVHTVIPVQGYYGSCICWSPDGKELATGGGDCAVRITSRSDYQSRSLVGHTGMTVSLAWNRDCLLASVGEEELLVWNRQDERRRVAKAEDVIHEIAWSPDGRFLAGAVSKKGLIVWDVEGNVIREREDLPVEAVAWCKDGRLAAAGDGIYVLSEDCKTLSSLLPYRGPACTSLCSGPVAASVISAHTDGRVRLWSEAGECVAVLEHNGPLTHVAGDGNAGRIAAASETGQVRIWDGEGNIIATSDHGEYVRALAWSPDGQWLGIAGGTTVHLWQPDAVTEFDCEADVRAIAWRHDSGQVAAGMVDLFGIRVFDLNDSKSLLIKELSDGPFALAYSPIDPRLVGGAEYGTLAVWNPVGASGIALPGHAQGIRAVCWKPDGKWFASASNDRTVRLWLRQGVAGPVLEHDWPVTHMAWSPTGDWLATAGPTGAVRLWTSDGMPGPPIPGHCESIVGIVWNRQGTMLTTACADGTLRFSDVTDKDRRWLVIVEDANNFARLDSQGRVIDGDRSRLERAFLVRTVDTAGNVDHHALSDLEHVLKADESPRVEPSVE